MRTDEAVLGLISEVGGGLVVDREGCVAGGTLTAVSGLAVHLSSPRQEDPGSGLPPTHFGAQYKLSGGGLSGALVISVPPLKMRREERAPRKDEEGSREERPEEKRPGAPREAEKESEEAFEEAPLSYLGVLKRKCSQTPDNS